MSQSLPDNQIQEAEMATDRELAVLAAISTQLREVERLIAQASC